MWLETMVNRLNDLHWGPFEAMRPPKDADIGRQLFIRVCAWGVFLIIAGSLLLLPVVKAYSFYEYYRNIPSLGQLGRMTWLVVGQSWWLALAGGGIFPLVWWPCVVCWNRRAARLRRHGSAPPTEDRPAGVWPPPPVRE